MDEILVKSSDPYNLFPIKRRDLWELYQKALNSMWFPSEVKLDLDQHDWNNVLTDDERYYLKNILAFFAEADAIVNENLLLRFQQEVQFIEAQFFYTFQAMMENIHHETYQRFLEAYISDQAERHKLLRATTQLPIIKKKADWAKYWITNETSSFAERLLAFAAIEGIFFSGSFAAIFYMRKRGLLPGLGQANELIARDEGLHQLFACHVYKNYLTRSKLSPERVREIVVSAVDLEKEFQVEALSVGLIGMNSNLMKVYIEFVADNLLVMIGEPKIYNVENPFDYMRLFSIDSLHNFFEKIGTNYTSGLSSGNISINYDNLTDL